MEISLFKNSYTQEPLENIHIDDFLDKVKEGHWKKLVDALRNSSNNEKIYKRKKAALPAVTVSGIFKSRDNQLAIDERLTEHSGLICLDIDAKDNPKMRIQDLIDRECYAQFASCSGKGIKIIYRCAKTSDPAVHRRIYDAAIQRLESKKINLKVDPIVKSIGSLQYVSYDKNLFHFPKSKLIIKPLPPIKVKKKKASTDQEKDLIQLNEYIDALGDKDITKSYEDWLTIGFGLSYSLGEAGRGAFHRLSKNYDKYSETETDEKYDACLESSSRDVARPTTIASVFQLLIEALPKTTIKQLAKKYNKSHAVGIGEDIEQGDLAGMVRYKLFLFKKEYEKDTPGLKDLIPWEINLNEFEKLLRDKGFKRYDADTYVHIVDNIVSKVDEHDILRIITDHIEADGDYCFSYKEIEFNFPWEELAFLWRKIRALGTTFNQIATCLQHWQPDLLQDTARESFIPYRNGIMKVTAKGWALLSYSSIDKQVWKERILPRDFKYEKKPGMFEDFFANTCGEGPTEGHRRNSEKYKRNLWYFGYMLHTFKDDSVSRAWMLYDIKAGNNGRTGKTIIGKAVGHIRSVTTLDGKQIDFRNNRFALQKVNPWTEVVFIDDPKKGMSIIPLFNMITGETDAERKGMDPITLKIKFMFASNWIMEAEETSEAGRQFITQVDDFYVQFGKKHKNTIKPIVDYHGKIFFTEWDEKDWNQFDSFCIRALHHHLGKDVPENKIVGNSIQVRFIQMYEMEMFHALINALLANKQYNSNNELIIGQRVMTGAFDDQKEHLQYKVSAGKVIRDFFRAIGVKEVSVSSAMIANQAQMVYKLGEITTDDLDLGTIETPIKHGQKKAKLAKKGRNGGSTGQNEKTKSKRGARKRK